MLHIRHRADILSHNSVSLGGSDGQESARDVVDLGSIPGLGRSPEEGNGYLLWYSGLENSMNRGTRQSMGSHRVRHDWVTFHFHFSVSTTKTDGSSIVVTAPAGTCGLLGHCRREGRAGEPHTLAFSQHKNDMLFLSQCIDQSRDVAPFNCTVVGELVGSPWIFSQMSLPQKDDQIFT